MASEIIGVGLACLDHLFICNIHDKVIQGGAKDFLSQGGGLTATAMVAAGRLGASTEIWSRIGDDFSGEFLLRDFHKDHVDTSQICIPPGSVTAVCAVLVDANGGERRFIFYPGRGLDVPARFDLSRIDHARCLLVDPHWLVDALKAAERAQQIGVPVVADIEGLSARTVELARRTDILIVPGDAATRYTGSSDPAVAIPKLRELGPRLAVITMGDRGGVYAGRLHPGDPETPVTRYDAFKVDVVDTTGCGDVFHGAFCFGLVQGWDLKRIATFASATSALKCRKLGGRTGIPTRNEVEAFLGAAQPL